MSRPSVLVRRGPRGVVHTAVLSRDLLPDGRLSFHDAPMCGTRGLSWRPAATVRTSDRRCRRCERLLQRPRPALLAAMVKAGRDQLERAALLELVRGWSDPATLSQVRGALIELGLCTGELATEYRKTSERLGERSAPEVLKQRPCSRPYCRGGWCKHKAMGWAA